MKNKTVRLLSLFALFVACSFPLALNAEDAPHMDPSPTATDPFLAPEEAAAPANKLIVLSKEESPPSFVVFLPEQIDTEWFWYYYTETQQHIVQSLVEKKLLDCGYEVIDLSMANLDDEEYSIEDITSPRTAVRMARRLGATYAIVGKAGASQAGRSVAYGVEVVRSGAEATARIVRVSDGKIIAIEEASSKGGGGAQKMAAQGALKEAGRVLADRLASRLNLLFLP